MEEERIHIIFDLKQGQQQRPLELKELDKALDWLRVLQAHQVEKAGRYNFDSLSFIDGCVGFDSYGLMMVDKCDDVDGWYEYQKPDGSKYLLNGGDFIIEAKLKYSERIDCVLDEIDTCLNDMTAKVSCMAVVFTDYKCCSEIITL